MLQGLLRIPRNARGIVLFAHGSGSGRLSPRNTYVAERRWDAFALGFLTAWLAHGRSAVRRSGTAAGRTADLGAISIDALPTLKRAMLSDSFWA